MENELMQHQTELQRPIELITQELQFFKLQASASILEIGKRLLEAKAQLNHGEWGEWLQREAEFSERTAQNFMKIAREYRNPQMIATMGNSSSKALLLLALEPESREEFVSQTHEVDGAEKTVSEMTTREMEQLVKELEAAQKEKQALQLQIITMEEETKNIQEDADTTQRNLENDVSIAEDEVEKLEEQQRALERELETLRNTPPEVDEDTLASIRKEVEEAAMEKERNRLEKQIEKAQKEVEQMKRDAEQAKQEAEAAKEKLQEQEDEYSEIVATMHMEKAAMEKKLSVAGNTKIDVFKVHFQGVQRELNEMLRLLGEFPEEDKEKMSKALCALCETVLSAAK